MKTFRLPDLGEGLQQAEVAAWHVRENDDVAVDQPLLSVETEKALVEIPSPRAGKIKRLLAKTGDLLPVGGALVEVADWRAVFGDCQLFNNDPYWRDLIPFHEYFHGDTGRGCGASHQTGWTGLVAKLIQPRRA